MTGKLFTSRKKIKIKEDLETFLNLDKEKQKEEIIKYVARNEKRYQFLSISSYLKDIAISLLFLLSAYTIEKIDTEIGLLIKIIFIILFILVLIDICILHE